MNNAVYLKTNEQRRHDKIFFLLKKKDIKSINCILWITRQLNEMRSGKRFGMVYNIFKYYF